MKYLIIININISTAFNYHITSFGKGFNLVKIMQVAFCDTKIVQSMIETVSLLRLLEISLRLKVWYNVVQTYFNYISCLRALILRITLFNWTFLLCYEHTVIRVRLGIESHWIEAYIGYSEMLYILSISSNFLKVSIAILTYVKIIKFRDYKRRYKLIFRVIFIRDTWCLLCDNHSQFL